VSSFPLIEGTISAKPFANGHSGGIAAPPEGSRTGTLKGSPFSRSGSISGESAESPETSAIAELGGLISSLGSLSAQAQSLPLSPPVLPGLPQTQNYKPQATDYTQFGEDSN
jgi:hypothetical protein